MQPMDPYLFDAGTNKHAILFLIQGLLLCVWLIPAIPAFLGILALLGTFPIPRLLARSLAGLSVVLGLFLTVLSGVFGPFTDTQAFHGVSLTIAIASSFLIWSGRDGKLRPSWAAMAGISVATVAALWSLFTVPVVLIQSRLIADGSPYCIAEHAENSPVKALHELRGFAFYTTKTGYKTTSAWYFHGLLVVDHPEEQRIYNWSPRRWKFDRIAEPDRLIKSVRNVCTPD